MVQSLIGFLIFAFFITSCQKDEVPKPPVDLGQIWICYHDSVWNENKITNALIGTWQWEYVACAWTFDQAHYVLDSNLTIEFKTDSFLIVKQNNEILQTSRWEIEEGDGDLYSVNDDPGNNQLFGRILICDERVIFNGSYIDGCDNYFKKIQ